jgi:putative flippase GtrA
VSSFRLPSDDLRTFGRFLVVGVLNTAFGYLTFALMLHWLTRPLALLCSHGLGVAFNFHSTAIGVFNEYRYRLLLRFVLAYSAVYGFNLALLESLCTLGNLPDLLAQGIAVPFSAVFSFVVLRRFVFLRRAVVARAAPSL